MAKRELSNGYKPLRPWERLVAYACFIFLIGLTFHQAHSEGVSVRLVLYMIAMSIAVPSAFVAFWDARVTVRVRRREWMQRRQAPRSQAASTAAQVEEAQFNNSTGTWSFFDDPAPTTN